MEKKKKKKRQHAWTGWERLLLPDTTHQGRSPVPSFSHAFLTLSKWRELSAQSKDIYLPANIPFPGSMSGLNL